MLLHDVIEFAARRSPEEVALIVGDRRWTYAELRADVRSLASWFADRLSPGERVGLVSDNSYEVVVALYAAPMAGVVLMLGNTRLVPAEIGRLLADVDPSMVIGSAEQLERLEGELGALAGIRAVRDFESIRGDLDAGVSAAPGRHVDADDVAWIIHTSGTTGRPKGAALTHRNLIAGVLNTALCRPVGADEVYLFPFPLFHVAAYNVIHLHLRARPVVLVAKFDAAEVLAATERCRVTSMSLAPTMIAMLLDHPEMADHDLGSLRSIFYGASAIPIDVLRRGLATFGCEFSQGYGMTELSGNAVFLDGAAHRRAATEAPHLLGAAGRPGPLAELRLVSLDDPRSDVAPGQPGEILVRGDQVISTYWDQPEATAASRVDGWFRTGDIGRFDEDGYLYIVDRSKDIIVSGGENVASLEVEDVLSEHPLVAQVAVVGVPDETWGERVVAVVVARPGSESGSPLEPSAVLEWARGRLAGFKRPKDLLVVDALPMNASGKVLKREVRIVAAGLLAD